MCIGTLLKMDAAREAYGAPIIVNHAFRSKADVKRIRANYPGAVANSAHEHGYAVDCAPAASLRSWGDWEKFLDALWAAGFRRFGIMRAAVHVDDDPERSSPAIWKYATTSPMNFAMCQAWFVKKTGSEK